MPSWYSGKMATRERKTSLFDSEFATRGRGGSSTFSFFVTELHLPISQVGSKHFVCDIVCVSLPQTPRDRLLCDVSKKELTSVLSFSSFTGEFFSLFKGINPSSFLTYSCSLIDISIRGSISVDLSMSISIQNICARSSSVVSMASSPTFPEFDCGFVF